MQIKVTCKDCGNEFKFSVPDKGYEDWKAGKLIQEAMPGVNADFREMLISGICPVCWEKMFGNDDEDYDS